MIEIKRSESDQLGALLEEHKIKTLVAKHKPQGLDVGFDVQWLDRSALAASFPRRTTTGPYFITLSPLLLERGLTDRIAFSTIILHELAHVIDRVQNWTRYAAIDPLDHPETLEYEADDFVVACGWRDGLIETLRLGIARGREHGIQEGMAGKRLSRFSNAV